METYFRIVSLLGGLALFLYGMRIMGDGLKSSSGSAMKAGLAKVTNNPFVGFIFGMLVTCMIQSSTATIVLTVGLVGAGFLSFRKSVGIVLGANVGTAITAQIIRLMDLQASSGSILNFFKSDNLAPTALIIGIILIMFVGTRTATSAGTIFMGFGILFVGLMNMSSAVSAMQDSLSHFLVAFEDNYFLGFLAGVLVTGVIQSSSAVVGIIQTLASSVGVTFCGIFAVIVGVNIGDCVTTYLVCRIGAKPEQIRTCLVHIIYNIFAAILIFVSIFILRETGVLGDNIWYMELNSGGVANVHGLFRLLPAVILLPFSGKFADIAEKLVPDKPLDPEDADIEKNLRELDMHLVTNPGLALNESHHLIYHMAGTAMHNLEACLQQLDDYDDKRSERIRHREEMLDRMADACNKYIIAISPNVTLERDLRNQSYQMKAYVCFERIGDLAVNVNEAIDRLHENKATFTKQAMAELRVGLDAVHRVLEISKEACKTDDITLAKEVEPMEEVVDELIDTLNEHHVARLTKGKCSIENGIEYQNILSNLERISDQCSDFAVALLAKTDDSIEGNEHEYINRIHTSKNPVYRRNFATDHALYFGKLEQADGAKAGSFQGTSDNWELSGRSETGKAENNRSSFERMAAGAGEEVGAKAASFSESRDTAAMQGAWGTSVPVSEEQSKTDILAPDRAAEGLTTGQESGTEETTVAVDKADGADDGAASRKPGEADKAAASREFGEADKAAASREFGEAEKAVVSREPGDADKAAAKRKADDAEKGNAGHKAGDVGKDAGRRKADEAEKGAVDHKASVADKAKDKSKTSDALEAVANSEENAPGKPAVDHVTGVTEEKAIPAAVEGSKGTAKAAKKAESAKGKHHKQGKSGKRGKK